jgi:hypothetical protein
MKLSLLAAAVLVAAPASAALVEVSPAVNLVSAPSALAAAGARLAPLALAPSALNLTFAPSAAAIAASPAAAPAALLTAAIAPAPSAAFAAAPLSGGAVPLRSVAPRTLTRTVSGAKDFAARAQLDAPSFDGNLALAYAPEAEASQSAAMPLARPRLLSAPLAPTGNLAAFGGVDHNGHVMRAALAALADRPAGASAALSFSPTPDSLRVLAGADGVLLARVRADGRWFLIKAGAAGFAATSPEYDLAVLGRPGSGRPTAADLEATAGRAGRFAVAAENGVFEWNTDMRSGAGAALENAFWGRALSRVAGRFYPRLLAATGVAAETRSWAKTTQEWIDAGRAPAAARHMAETIIPGWMKTELPITVGKLGLERSADYFADVLNRSKVWVYTWHSRWTYEVSDGLPDGHYDAKFGIRTMLKMNWRRLKDPETHFRVLYAHEYTHWLQNEGVVTRRYGIEIPAVAVEQLRALELVGWEGMKSGRIGFIAEGNLRAFESGREWARGGMADATALMYRGVLGGAAYEVGVMTGRPEAAWEFLNLVIAEKGGLPPREAFAKVSGSTPVAAR